MKIFFDGGCRPNPGAIEVAVVAGGIVYHRERLGYGSNNDAEWLACLYALVIARQIGAVDLELLGDSATIIDQANGAARCHSSALAAHLAEFEIQRSTFSRVRIRRVKRSQNLAGIFMSKRHSGR